MKTTHWFFAVSVALFLSGIAFVLAAGRSVRSAPAAPVPAAAPATPVASVKQIMSGVTGPAAGELWNAVSMTISLEGTVEKRPQTDDEWTKLTTSAALLGESANLLTDASRAPDKGDWLKMARAMADAAGKARQFTIAKDADGLLRVGEELNMTCDACHERYSRN